MGIFDGLEHGQRLRDFRVAFFLFVATNRLQESKLERRTIFNIAGSKNDGTSAFNARASAVTLSIISVD